MKQPDAGPDGGGAEEAAHNLAILIQRIASRYGSSAYRDGLRPGQWDALRYFAAAPSGARRVKDFARHRGITSGAASALISRLVERELLVSDDPYGSRNVDLRPTEAGRAALAQDPFDVLRQAAAATDPQARAAALQALGEMLDWLDRR
jgi:DNA-binding MarR family transcriptional regulator